MANPTDSKSAKITRPKFTGGLAFVLAAAGSAVGLGNIWRFPYLAAQYGGGIFLLTYIILVITLGLTFSLTENALGRMTGKSAIGAFESFGKKYKWIGLFIFLIPVIIFPYYSLIGGWVTKYFVTYATGGSSIAAQEDFFSSFISSPLEPMFWGLLFILFCIFVVWKGVESGIERANKVMMPALFVLLIIVTIYALTLPGAMEGVKYYFVPDFSKFSFEMVLAAMGQMFYSLSLAMAILITYGSYLPKSEDLESSVLKVNLMDTCVAFLAGLMIIPAVFAVLGPENLNSGPGLMFVTLPGVFASTPLPGLMGAFFFLLVIFAAATSGISLFESIVSICTDTFGWTRYKACLIMGIIAIVMMAASSAGYGLLDFVTILGFQILDFFDFISNSVMMPIAAIITCLFVGFVVGTKAIDKEISQTSKFVTKPFYNVILKFIAPVLVALILISNIVSALAE